MPAWIQRALSLLATYMDVGDDMDVTTQRPDLGPGRGFLTNSIKSNGFSLIELLSIMAIISILGFTSFPGLNSLLSGERSTVLTNRIAGSMAYARSIAVTQNRIITACQSNDQETCHKSGNWHQGWILFNDINNNKQRDENETLIHVNGPEDNGTIAIFKGSAGIKHYLRYKPSGRAYPNGSFLICHPGRGIGKALIMAQSGRLRLSKIQTNGKKVTC